MNFKKSQAKLLTISNRLLKFWLEFIHLLLFQKSFAIVHFPVLRGKREKFYFMMYLKYIMFRNILLSVFLFFMIGACCSSNETAGEFGLKQPAYKKIADEKYSKNYNTIFNSDSTYLFVYFSSKNVNKVLPFP